MLTVSPTLSFVVGRYRFSLDQFNQTRCVEQVFDSGADDSSAACNQNRSLPRRGTCAWHFLILATMQVATRKL